MKKKIMPLLLCMAIIAFPIYSFAESESTPIDGFRDFKWGTSFEDVEEAVITNDMVYDVDYISADYDDGTSALLVINGSVSSFDAMVYYSFQDKLLVGGMYRLQEKHSNDNTYYDDYCKLVDLYTEVYGDPSATQEDWSDDLYKDDENRIGMAISAGHLTVRTVWMDDEGNKISLVIFGDNFEITTDIHYYCSKSEYSSNTDGI